MPSVVLVTERFTALAKASMRGNGVPSAPMVVRTVAKEAVEMIVSQLRGSATKKNI